MESQSRATILLVEDDPGVARLEQLRLERAGFTVVTAATAGEGLDQVARGEIDLIILDQRLNASTSGLEFFRQIKESGYNVPAILVTGLNDENMLIEVLACRRARLRPQDAALPRSSRADRQSGARSGAHRSASWPSRA